MSNISTDVAQAALSKTTARQYSHRPGTGVVVVAIILSLLSLLPLGFVIGIAIDTGWSTVKALVFRPRVGELLINTVLLVVSPYPFAPRLALH